MTTASTLVAQNGITNYTQYPNNLMFPQSSMSNDFLGSQIFGNTPVMYQQVAQQSVATKPTGSNNAASKILQAYIQATMPQAAYQQTSGSSTSSTMQAYWYATQLADSLSGNIAIPNMYSSNDFLSRQSTSNLFYNGALYA